MKEESRYRKAKTVTLVGAFFNLLLSIFKMLFGVLGHSHALFADGVHSMSDLLSDVLVLVASKYGSQAADESHPYGHRRIETAATMFLSLFLVIVGVLIAFDGFRHLLMAHQRAPIGHMVLVVTVVSILVNEALYHYTRRSGERLQSKLLVANAWHHRSDAASSLVVLVGVIGSLVGYPYFDALAAIIVGLMIVQMGSSLAWSSVSELVDSSVEKQSLDEIEEHIKNTSGVVAIHQLRTRSMAGAILVDVHVLVDERLSVSEGHHIAQNVALNLRNKVTSISDVTVHIDPEDDEIAKPCISLPSRVSILPRLKQVWHGLEGYDALYDVNIHYLDGKLKLVLYFSSQHIDVNQFKQTALSFDEIDEIKLYYQLPD